MQKCHWIWDRPKQPPLLKCKQRLQTCGIRKNTPIIWFKISTHNQSLVKLLTAATIIKKRPVLKLMPAASTGNQEFQALCNTSFVVAALQFCLEWPKSHSLHTRKCNTHEIQHRSYNKRRVEGATFLTGHYPVPLPVPAAEFFTLNLKNSDQTKSRWGRLWRPLSWLVNSS